MPIARNLEAQIAAMQAGDGLFYCPHIAAHDDGRVLRRHDDADQLIDAAGDFGHDIFDEGRSEAHAGIHLEAWPVRMLPVQFILQGCRLLAGNLEQWRAADEVIAPAKLGH